MNRSSRLLCALYVATSAGLAWTSVLEFRYGPLWAACLCAAAGLVPVIAVVRETVIWDLRRLLRYAASLEQGCGHGAADLLVCDELNAACCERWWTSLGCDHDATCPHRIPRSSSAA
jgi:hypothetical protein